MEVSRIRFTNIMGVDFLDFKPGSITEISGENAAGKSTVLAALLGLIGKGTDATLIRDGATTAEVVLALDDGLEFEKQWTTDGKPAKLTARREGGPPLPRAQSILDSLFDRLVNPLDFLTGDKEKQAAWLFEAMPLKVTASQLSEAIGDSGSVVDVARLAEKHALVALDATYADVYELRRQSNVAAMEKRKTERQVAATLPVDDGEDWTARANAAEQRAGAIRERLASAETTADQMLETESGEADIEYLTTKGAAEKAAALKVSAAEREGAAVIAVAARARDKRVADARAERDGVLATLRGTLAGQLTEAQIEATSAGGRAAEFLRASTARALADKMAGEAEALEATWKERDDAVKRLEALRENLLEALPIAGLEYRAGKIYRSGIVLDRLNTQQQIELAVDVAELRAGKAGLILVDGLERLDARRYAAFINRARTTGLQYICTRVSNEGTLQVQKIA